MTYKEIVLNITVEGLNIVAVLYIYIYIFYLFVYFFMVYFYPPGSGVALMSNFEQLLRGVWRPETNEILNMSL